MKLTLADSGAEFTCGVHELESPVQTAWFAGSHITEDLATQEWHTLSRDAASGLAVHHALRSSGTCHPNAGMSQAGTKTCLSCERRLAALDWQKTTSNRNKKGEGNYETP